MELKRDYLTTNEAARVLGVQGATVRRGLCVQGHYLGLRPVKLPNNRLLWSVRAVERILNSNEE
jgi:hypothetical protein